MNLLIAIGLGSLALVVVAGLVLTANANRLRLPGWAEGPMHRARTAIDASILAIGRPLTALYVSAAGLFLLILMLWVLGVVAHRTESYIDWPAFRFVESRQVGGQWQSLWNHLTRMGNRPQTQRLTVVAAVAFTGIWVWRRRPNWWAPLVALPTAYLMEKYGGIIIKKVVDRGHPPTTHGTWVSGGCARLLIVYGLIILLTLRVTNANRRWQVAGFSVLAFLATVEAYSRIYLLKHWITDVFGGLMFGAGLLIIASIAFSILDRPGERQPVGPQRTARELDTGDRSVDMRDRQSAWRSSAS